MALRKKEMKKSSYYVWFLGAQECRGLRGEEYVRPVVRYFMDQERDTEPMKVTLQVSGRGLKIIQSFGGSGEAPKHFIPHHAITCVVQEPAPNHDIVSAILLIYNPITKCPVHVHSYRCDSSETASILRYQLSQLIEREDNQRKLGEIESRLEAKGLLPPTHRSASGSDGRSTKDSESSGSWDRDQNRKTDRIANLYDSLAAELRQKLGKKVGTPILLPPRDYDTVSRKQGRLEGIQERRSRQANIVGVVGKNRDDSSGKSSGIGSDEASSPVHQRPLHSSSEDEWENEPRSFSEESLFLVQPQWKQKNEYNRKVSQRRSSPPKEFKKSPPHAKKRSPETRQRTPSPSSPRHSFAAAREKFIQMEKKQIQEQKQSREIKRQPSRVREDWSKKEKDTGYLSKDAFISHDVSKNGKPKITSPQRKLSENNKINNNDIKHKNNNNRVKNIEKPQIETKRKQSRDELLRSRSYSREFDCSGSCSSCCDSAECLYDRRYRSSDALDGFINPSKNSRQQIIKNRSYDHLDDRRNLEELHRQPVPKNKSYDQLDNKRTPEEINKDSRHPLSKNRSYDQLNNRRKTEEIRRNKSFDQLEKGYNYDNRNRNNDRPMRYRSQEEVNVRRREDDLRRREDEILKRQEDELLRKREEDFMRKKEDNFRKREEELLRRAPEDDRVIMRRSQEDDRVLIRRGQEDDRVLMRRGPEDDRVIPQAINRYVNRDKFKRQGYIDPKRQDYVELESHCRYPGLDRETARVHHHSLQHLPMARGPLGGPGEPMAQGFRPPFERSQSELPPHWQQNHGFGRYSYAEPSSYHRAHVGIASGY